MNTWRFITERFPLKITLPLTAILCLASLNPCSYSSTLLIISYASIFISLLILRAVDDICSIGIDKIKSPERGLVSGRIDSARLAKALKVLILLNIFININFKNIYFNKALFFTTAITLYYFLFYKSIKLIPVIIKPLFSNLVFICIPSYASLIALNKLSLSSCFLGLFIYTSVIAHEYSHNVLKKNTSSYGIINYTDLLGMRGTAALSFSCFIAAFVFALIFWFNINRPILFFITLTITMLQIIVMEIRLMIKPCAKNSKPFYIYGFAFFLLPLLSLIIETLLTAILSR